MGTEQDGWLISARWGAQGTHLGERIYNKPPSHSCQLWGITQWRVNSSIIEAEGQLFDGFDLIMQITQARNNSSQVCL